MVAVFSFKHANVYAFFLTLSICCMLYKKLSPEIYTPEDLAPLASLQVPTQKAIFYI